MLNLLGALCLTGGGLCLGLGAVGDLENRVRGLTAWVQALELLERELSFRLPSMPDLLSELAHRAPKRLSGFFTACGAGMDELGERSFGEIWDGALSDQPAGLGAEDLGELRALGAVLGRYDGEGQRQAAAAARQALTAALERAREDRRRQGKVYGVMGAACGGFLTLLLI